MRKMLIGVSSGLFLIAAPSFAHHSAVMFDDTKEVTVSGVVKDQDGSVTTWGFEAEGPSTLTRAGIRKSDFAPGTELTITGNPMKDGRPAAAWIKAKRGDGKDFNPRAGFAIN